MFAIAVAAIVRGKLRLMPNFDNSSNDLLLLEDKWTDFYDKALPGTYFIMKILEVPKCSL